ncbi:MAG: phosphotransferase [Firmicutes bacterium]|nr:phosphotransferase [Bacillota bacterium]MDD4337319.1 phosphotransferase [Bacillota bacterium]MDD4792474.1 phosphotransferase [Bacillota bacterium]
MRCERDEIATALWPILGEKAWDVRVVAALSAKKSRAFLLSVLECDCVRRCPMVTKIYKDEGRAFREAEVLARLGSAGVPVPAVVGATPTVLLRRYIDGPVLRDLDCTPVLARKLATWLHSCHVALGSARAEDGMLTRAGLVGDMNLGNFIIDMAQAGQDVCGIDFGDTRIGDPLEDVGEGFMRIFSHGPGYTPDRRECAVAFVREYGRLAGAEDRVWPEVQRHAVEAFRRVAIWRGDPFMNDMAEAVGKMWISLFL